MNSKKAKALRRVARNATKIAENQGVGINKVAYVENEHQRRYAYSPVLDDEGKPLLEDDGITPKMNRVLVNNGTTRLDPTCERADYLKMKKQIKRST